MKANTDEEHIRMKAGKYAIFQKVMELQGLTQAARALGCTQSGVSHAISALEEELGFILIKRGRSGVELTPEGERVYPIICRISDGIAELEREAAAMRTKEKQTLRVATFTSVAVHWLPGIIKEFERDYPGVSFDLVNGDYHDVAQAMKNGTVDMGFVTLPCDLPDCEFIQLKKDRLLVVLPRTHKLAGLSEFPVSVIPSENFISLLEVSNHDARRALEMSGVKANVKFTTKDDYAIIAMVEQGLGISIMPELLLLGHTEKVTTMPLENGATRTIGLAVANKAKENPYVGLFAGHVKRWVENR